MSLADLDSPDLARLASDHVAAITSALDELDQVLGVLVDRDSLAVALWDLRDVKKRAAEVYATCESALLAEAGDKDFVVPNLGRFSVKRQTKRTGWVWDRLVPDLVVYARTDRRMDSTSGEVEGEGEAVARTLRDCVGFSYGKVRELERRGFNADEFCTVEEGGYSVQLPSADLA